MIRSISKDFGFPHNDQTIFGLVSTFNCSWYGKIRC